MLITPKTTTHERPRGLQFNKKLYEGLQKFTIASNLNEVTSI